MRHAARYTLCYTFSVANADRTMWAKHLYSATAVADDAAVSVVLYFGGRVGEERFMKYAHFVCSCRLLPVWCFAELSCNVLYAAGAHLCHFTGIIFAPPSYRFNRRAANPHAVRLCRECDTEYSCCMHALLVVNYALGVHSMTLGARPRVWHTFSMPQ